jgi:hypothetical protein
MLGEWVFRMEKCCQEEGHKQNFCYLRCVAGDERLYCTRNAPQDEAEEGDLIKSTRVRLGELKGELPYC